jgi:PII-like signaling protein
MDLNGKAKLVRVYIGESDKWHGKPLYEAMVRLCREKGIAGATVIRGVLGYGANSRIHSAKLLELSSDLPLIVEIVDCEERLMPIMPELESMVSDGLITVENVEVIKYINKK